MLISHLIDLGKDFFKVIILFVDLTLEHVELTILSPNLLTKSFSVNSLSLLLTFKDLLK
jgi:hypothetical protein